MIDWHFSSNKLNYKPDSYPSTVESCHEQKGFTPVDTQVMELAKIEVPSAVRRRR